jgi:hypothetical protein
LQIDDQRKDCQAHAQKAQGPRCGRPAAEKLGDSGPKSQENPQRPDKNQQSPKNARW